MNSILKEDIERIISRNDVDFRVFSGKTVLVTGATGLIGFNLVCALLAANEALEKPVHVAAMVRSREKAERMYGERENLEFVVQDVTSPVRYDGAVDYIVHAASPTSSKAFIEEPVEVINTAVLGTMNVLAFAKEKHVASMVYLSTMEVYGTPDTEEKIAETHGTNLDVMKVRSSYPESKRMCECLCASYAAEYGVPVKVMRLTQTFGPGVRYDDGRVFAEFVRCAIERRNIVLRTEGRTKRNYLYTADAVAAILVVLTRGAHGEAYNAANEEIFCSIREFAEVVCRECGEGQIEVEVRVEDGSKYGYAPTLFMNLDTGKLRELGWRACYPLGEMVRRLCVSMRE